MAKKFLQKYLPDPKKIKENKHLRIFGKFLHDPNLWHFNRYSVATGVSIGLFCAYLPTPGHMLAATLLSILFRANLPISVLLVWVSNPFTIPPQFYLAYKIGTWVMGLQAKSFHFEITFRWFLHELHTYALPLLVGSLICGTVLAILGNIAIRIFWRCSVAKAWKNRNTRRNTLQPIR
jgi:hypothetical protein